MAQFPLIRPRRLRDNPKIRHWIQENHLHVDSLVMPIFVRSGKKIKRAIKTMPGIFQLSPDEVLKECEALLKANVKSILLFGIPPKKDALASWASRDDGVVQEAIGLIKKKFPELLLIADVCLCDYTDHGHCGVIKQEGKTLSIDNDASLEILTKIAASLARAGADVIAPSDMMDGRVSKIRDELDAVGFKHLPILSYAVKYASSFYGPFREALESAPRFGDRKGYQMNPANLREAFREAEQDIEEGADILMVKPGLSSLDVIYALRQRCQLPIAAYQVSGEYAAIRFAAQKGAFDETAAVLESWMALRRAGADIIVSYFARDFAKYLK